MAVDNKTIGKFHLADIPSAPRGIPQIEVSFDIDADGILNVNAKDKATGKEQSIRIEASSGLSDSEVDKMVNDAKKHEQEDKEKRESVEIKNQAEQLIYQTEKNIDENGDKLGSEKDKLTKSLEKLKKANEGSNIDDIKSSIEELNSVWNTCASKMYEASKSEDNSEPVNEESDKKSSSKNKDEKEIEDADFEVVD